MLVDIIFILSLVALVISWWLRGWQHRQKSIIGSMVLVLASVIYGLTLSRWQLVPGGGLAILIGLVLAYCLAKNLPERTGKPWVSGPLITVAALFPIFLIYSFPAPDLPAPSGEYAVGVRDFELTDNSRTGLLEAAPEEGRRLFIRSWYPTTETKGYVRRPYFSELEAEHTAKGIGTLVGLPFMFTYIRNSLTNSYVDAPTIKALHQQPVVIYSHGYSSFPGQNTVLMENLASHGYIVFSVHHPYDSSSVVFPNGDVIEMSDALVAQVTDVTALQTFAKSFTGDNVGLRREAALENYNGMVDAGERIAVKSAPAWVDDRRFVQEMLATRKVPESIADVVAMGDFSQTGEMGMSFGGTTAAALCMHNSRCAAAINLDGGDYHFTTFNQNMPVPFMMFHSDYRQFAAQLTGDPDVVAHGFNNFSYERHEVAGLNKNMYRFRTDDVSHLGISDFNYFLRNPIRKTVFGSIDGETMLQIQNDFVRSFFDTHLRGHDVGFPLAQLKTHEAHVSEFVPDDVRQYWLAEHPLDKTIEVSIETSEGNIEVSLYPNRAPLSVAKFLKHVDAGDYNGAKFYRATNIKEGSGIGVVQGGLAAESMTGAADDVGERYVAMGTVEHETTTATGINNERGTLAYARFAPGTAGTEIFFNIDDNPGLNTGVTTGSRDGFGYATFGRVLRGQYVLDRIQKLPTDTPTTIKAVSGQLLTEPVVIRKMYRSSR